MRTEEGREGCEAAASEAGGRGHGQGTREVLTGWAKQGRGFYALQPLEGMEPCQSILEL